MNKEEVSAMLFGKARIEVDVTAFQVDDVQNDLRNMLFSFICVYPNAAIIVLNVESAAAGVINFFKAIIDEDTLVGEVLKRKTGKKRSEHSRFKVLYLFCLAMIVSS